MSYLARLKGLERPPEEQATTKKTNYTQKASQTAQTASEGLRKKGAASDAAPRLPWQLENLARAATSDVLAAKVQGVSDPSRYVLAWCTAYLLGDREEALGRLWKVYEAWDRKGVN